MNNPSIAINYFNCSIEAMWDILANIVWSQQCRSYNTIICTEFINNGKKKTQRKSRNN